MDIIKFICNQFILRIVDIVFLQRGKLISLDYKRTNMKNGIGEIHSGRGTYRSQLLLPYIPGVHESHILSEQWAKFFNDPTSDFTPNMTVPI